MTIEDLCNNLELQGPVRVSHWDDEGMNETICYEDADGIYMKTDLAWYEVPAWFRDIDIGFMFVGGDHVLHIELESE